MIKLKVLHLCVFNIVVKQIVLQGTHLMINLITVLSIEGPGTPGREMGLSSVMCVSCVLDYLKSKLKSYSHLLIQHF